MRGWSGGRQTMVLLEGDMLMLYPNVEALIQNPASQVAISSHYGRLSAALTEGWTAEPARVR